MKSIILLFMKMNGDTVVEIKHAMFELFLLPVVSTRYF